MCLRSFCCTVHTFVVDFMNREDYTEPKEDVHELPKRHKLCNPPYPDVIPHLRISDLEHLPCNPQPGHNPRRSHASHCLPRSSTRSRRHNKLSSTRRSRPKLRTIRTLNIIASLRAQTTTNTRRACNSQVLCCSSLCNASPIWRYDRYPERVPR